MIANREIMYYCFLKIRTPKLENSEICDSTKFAIKISHYNFRDDAPRLSDGLTDDSISFEISFLSSLTSSYF